MPVVQNKASSVWDFCCRQAFHASAIFTVKQASVYVRPIFTQELDILGWSDHLQHTRFSSFLFVQFI